jgi:hypothetical protein
MLFCEKLKAGAKFHSFPIAHLPVQRNTGPTYFAALCYVQMVLFIVLSPPWLVKEGLLLRINHLKLWLKGREDFPAFVIEYCDVEYNILQRKRNDFQEH